MGGGAQLWVAKAYRASPWLASGGCVHLRGSLRPDPWALHGAGSFTEAGVAPRVLGVQLSGL